MILRDMKEKFVPQVEADKRMNTEILSLPVVIHARAVVFGKEIDLRLEPTNVTLWKNQVSIEAILAPI